MVTNCRGNYAQRMILAPILWAATWGRPDNILFSSLAGSGINY